MMNAVLRKTDNVHVELEKMAIKYNLTYEQVLEIFWEGVKK